MLNFTFSFFTLLSSVNTVLRFHFLAPDLTLIGFHFLDRLHYYLPYLSNTHFLSQKNSFPLWFPSFFMSLYILLKCTILLKWHSKNWLKCFKITRQNLLCWLLNTVYGIRICSLPRISLKNLLVQAQNKLICENCVWWSDLK